ncbi:MAG: 50S ribosomal protein L19 [Candidatus Shapirobacteria bacterium]
MANQVTIKEVNFKVGDTIVVQQKIKEGDKLRVQPFEGVVLAIKNREENKTFTVRKIASGGIGVERIWPVNSPWIEGIKIKRAGRVRRAKLYYLRKRVGKAATKIKAAKTPLKTKLAVKKKSASKVKTQKTNKA